MAESKEGAPEESKERTPEELTESPVTQAKYDRLGFQKYVDQLMTFIKKHETPLVIGIYGEWGSGKTSLMRLLKERMEQEQEQERERERERYCTVWFTAWRYGGEAATLRRTFLLNVLGEMAKNRGCDAVKRQSFWQRVLHFIQESWWLSDCVSAPLSHHIQEGEKIQSNSATN